MSLFPEKNRMSSMDFRDTSRVSKRPFELKGSFGPTTHEVASMRERVEKEGRAITVYEFVQGMVDYQKGNPPARIFLVYRDGKKIPYSGSGVISRQELKAIEFYNTGPGLKPSDVVDVRHGGGDKTLGKWGRGTAVAVTYLASKGINVEIESNSKDPETGTSNRAWSGITGLKANAADGEESLNLDGRWEEGTAVGTTFRVVNPDKNFVQQVQSLSEDFLPANPNCEDAAVVEKVENLKTPAVDISFQNKSSGSYARVRCLKNIVYFKEGASNLYVDGLKVEDRQGYRGGYKFPWAIEGFKDMAYPLGVERSFDSAETQNGNASSVVQLALRHNKNPGIFKELLIEVVNKDESDLPLELRSITFPGSVNMDLSTEAKRALNGAWAEVYGGDAIFAKTKASAQKIKKQEPGRKVILLEGSMADWLKQAGVSSAEDLIEEKTNEFKAGEGIAVEYVDSPDALIELFREAGLCDADPEIEILDGKKVVKVSFPYSISNSSDFFDRKKPGATWARIAAIIAHEIGLGISIESRYQDRVTSLKYDVREVDQSRVFNTPVTTTEIKAENNIIKENPQGNSSVVLSGDVLQMLEPEPGMADSLKQIAIEISKNRKTRKDAVKTKYPSSGLTTASSKNRGVHVASNIDRRKFLSSAAAVLGVGTLGAVGNYLLKNGKDIPWESLFLSSKDQIFHQGFTLNNVRNSSIGNPRDTLGVFNLERKGGKLVAPLNLDTAMRFESKNILETNGYYRQFVGTVFAPNKAIGNKGQWVDSEEYEKVNAPHSEPKDYQSKIQLFNLNGVRRLMIKEGQAVLGIESSGPAEIKREKRSHNLVIEGDVQNDGVVVYLGKDPEGPNKAKPIDVESRSMLSRKALNKDWSDFIAAVNSTEKMTLDQKAAVVLEKWSAGYEYNDKESLDEQTIGENTEQIAAQIVNSQKGICNTAATGLVALLREVGVPSRVVSGFMKTPGGGDYHMWAEYWNGSSWHEVESLYKSKTNSTTQKHMSSYLESIADSPQHKATEALAKKSEETIKQINQKIYGSEVAPPKPAALKKDDVKPISEWVRDAAFVGVGAIGKTIADRLLLASRNRRNREQGKPME